jgi:hypothetical protein
VEVKDYWVRFVKPLVSRFNMEQQSIHLAFAACVAVGHVSDYLNDAQTSPKSPRDWLSFENERYIALRAICDAAKHGEASHKQHGLYLGTNIDDFHVGSAAAFSDGSFFSDDSSWSESADVVRIRIPHMGLVDVSWLLQEVADKIEAKLSSLI